MREAARVLGVDESTLSRWLRKGEISAHQVNDQYEIDRLDLLEFASSRNIDVPLEMLEETDAPDWPMPGLADAVRAGGVHRGVRAADKAAALRAVVDLLPLPPGADRAFVHHMLLARERLGSTGLGHGVAIPHPRSPIVLRVPTAAAAICYLETPIDYEAIDGQPVHTIVALVCPSVRVHLHVLARVAAALRDPAFVARLEAKAEAAEMVAEAERVEASLARRRAGGRGTEA